MDAINWGKQMALGEFEVLAGDFKKGRRHHQSGKKLFMRSPKNWIFRERVKFKNISSVQEVTQENSKSVLGTAGWGLAGGLALGPLGLLTGVLAGGNKSKVTFACELIDGRRFLAVSNRKVFAKIQAAVF